MATIIPADGRPPYEVTPGNGKIFTLAELKAVVGGYLEALQAPDGRIAYLNEDGKRLELPVNVHATILLRASFDRASHRLTLPPGDVIVGDVILCTLAETGDEDPEDPPNRCQEYWPDHNGECQHCDEWAGEHSLNALAAGEARAARERRKG